MYKGYYRINSNNYNELRNTNGKIRLHKGVDINFSGGGNTDLGAPVLATHDGVVTRLVRKLDGNSGGIRIKIQSQDGTVATFYMHLQSIDPNLQLNSFVTEGQQIGNLGGSGDYKYDRHPAHLHYEVFLNNAHINPCNEDGSFIDAQKLLKISGSIVYNGGQLEQVTVTGNCDNRKIMINVPIAQIPTIKIEYNDEKEVK